MTHKVPQASAPLSIAIIGGGNIGSIFAYHLAEAGHHVTVIARPDSLRLRQLQRDLGIVNISGERRTVQVADKLDENVAYELIIVTILAHQVDALLPTLQRSKSQARHFMFNNFAMERIGSLLGAQRCTYGMPFVMARLDQDGKLAATVSAKRKTLHGDRRWVALFEAAGIPSKYESNMPLWLRCHVPVCIAMESIAVMAQQRGGGAAWKEAMAVARGMRTGFAIIKELGYPLYPRGKKAMNSLPISVVAGLFWLLSRVASFRDVLATGKNECRVLIDVVVAAAKKMPPSSAVDTSSLREIRPAG